MSKIPLSTFDATKWSLTAGKKTNVPKNVTRDPEIQDNKTTWDLKDVDMPHKNKIQKNYKTNYRILYFLIIFLSIISNSFILKSICLIASDIIRA